MSGAAPTAFLENPSWNADLVKTDLSLDPCLRMLSILPSKLGVMMAYVVEFAQQQQDQDFCCIVPSMDGSFAQSLVILLLCLVQPGKEWTHSTKVSK